MTRIRRALVHIYSFRSQRTKPNMAQGKGGTMANHTLASNPEVTLPLAPHWPKQVTGSTLMSRGLGRCSPTRCPELKCVLLGASSSARAWTSADAGTWKKTGVAEVYGTRFIAHTAAAANTAATRRLVSSAFYTNSDKRGFLPSSDISVTHDKVVPVQCVQTAVSLPLHVCMAPGPLTSGVLWSGSPRV